MKIVGMMVCGPGEGDRYLQGTLDEFNRLVDDAVFVGNNTDPKTEQMLKQSGFWFYRDDREWGIHQPTIKTDLLKRVGTLNPSVVIPLDSDEQYDDTFTRQEAEKWGAKYPGCYSYIVNLWNTPDRQRKALGFWNVRMFQYRPEHGLQYQRKNVHCGLAPPFAYHYGGYIPHLVRHYGLMSPEDRQSKVSRYELYDPKAKWKDRAYYDALKTDTNGSEFDETEMLTKIRAEVDRMGDQSKMVQAQEDKKFVYVRRIADQKTMDMTQDEWEEIARDRSRSREFELLGDVETYKEEEKIIEPPTMAEGVKIQCPICGEAFRSANQLSTHRKTHL